ncbi:MAG: hypothetical protein ACXAEU_22785 [Candidatus Hodarchaeales archaeon]|jgi:predicted transcriptional regulator
MAIQSIVKNTSSLDIQEVTDIQEQLKLPKSALLIVNLLSSYSRPLDSTFIKSKVKYSIKTTRKSLKLLMNYGIVEKKYSLVDARKFYYKLTYQRVIIKG